MIKTRSNPRFAELRALISSKPEQLQRSSPEVERWFVEFQRAHGTFWSALFGFAGCFQAALRRSTRIANVMIVLGCMAIGALIWVTLKHAGA